jgi:hypothetical protein
LGGELLFTGFVGKCVARTQKEVGFRSALHFRV